MAQQAGKGAKIVLPLTVTHVAEALAEPHDVEIVRSKVSMPAFTRAASEDGVVFAGALGGGYIFPQLPARLRRHHEPRQAARAAGAAGAAR